VPLVTIEGVHLFGMPRQVARVTEGLPAGSSAVGAIAGMGAHVCRQADVRREGVATGCAGVGAVAGMGVEVCRQVVGS